jgi:hypothetical protein
MRKSPQTKNMKIQSKLTSLICITSMVAGSFAFAEEAVNVTPEIAVCPPIEGFDPRPIHPDVEGPCIFPAPLEEPITNDDSVVDTDSEGVVSEEEGQVDENVVVDSGDAVEDQEIVDGPTDADGGNGVPIEWVKRGGGDDEVTIMFATTGGPGTVLQQGETSNAVARELGQEGKAAAIESKANVAAPEAMGEKKEPVALIKKGRVFLR